VLLRSCFGAAPSPTGPEGQARLRASVREGRAVSIAETSNSGGPCSAELDTLDGGCSRRRRTPALIGTLSNLGGRSPSMALASVRGLRRSRGSWAGRSIRER
jgi:hypothetical protein